MGVKLNFLPGWPLKEGYSFFEKSLHFELKLYIMCYIT